MDSGTGDRGVSEVMGFILVFGMLVISFTVYQGIVVPDQNRQVEFQHNQEVQGQLQDLRNAIVGTASTGTGQAVSVTLGASYPTRTIAQNLGVSGGSIQTASSESIQITNARALDSETRDYLDGSERSFDTKPIRYTPVYSFYSGAPRTVYENTLAYNEFDDANLTLTDQILVDGRRFTLIAIDGSLSRAERDTVSVNTQAISASSNRVAVRNSTGQQITIRVPTRLSASKWEEMLEDEMGANGYVEQIVTVPGENAVELVMQQGVTYELRMAKVGVGDAKSDERATYITDIQGDDISVPEGGTQKLVVEIRDRLNNPVSNVSVTHGAPGSVSPSSETTDSDGRVAFVYSAPSDVNVPQDVDIDVSFDGDGTENETVTFDLQVLDSDGSGGGAGGGPSNYAIDWSISSIKAEDGVESCTGNSCTYNLSKDANTNLPLVAHTSPALSGVFVDFSTNDSSIVDSLTPEEDTTDASGQTIVTADIDTTGTAAIFASATEDSDKLVLQVTDANDGGGGGGGGSTPQIARRIDDISHVTTDNARFVTSYDVSNTNGSFQRVSVEYVNQNDGSANAVVNSTDFRGNLRYDNGYGASDSYTINVRVIYQDGSGNDYVAAQETITDVADAQNPVGNEDLSTGSSPAFQSISVTDQSNPGQGPRYRINYNVAPASNFQQVEAYVIGLNGAGGEGSQTSPSSNSQFTVSPGYGYNNQFKVTVLVFDADGTVVDAQTYTDIADGSGP